MASKQGLQQRLQEAARRRQKQPRPQAVETGPVRRDRWQQILDHHQDVLQNIEFAILDTWQQHSEIDDQRALQALRGAMRHLAPPDPLAAEIYERLRSVEALRRDIDAELWLDALRVVAESVGRHSTARGGDRSYLNVVLPFMAPALGSGDDRYDDDEDAEDGPGEMYEVIEGRIARTSDDPPAAAGEPHRIDWKPTDPARLWGRRAE